MNVASHVPQSTLRPLENVRSKTPGPVALSEQFLTGVPKSIAIIVIVIIIVIIITLSPPTRMRVPPQS
jgi:hypothetical protein